MKIYKMAIILLLVSVIGIISWSFYSKKSLDHIRQHATLVKAEMHQTYYIGRYKYE